MKELVLLFRYELWMIVAFPAFEQTNRHGYKREKRYIKVEEIHLLLKFSGSVAAVKLQTGLSGLTKMIMKLLSWTLFCRYHLSRLTRVLSLLSQTHPDHFVLPFMGRRGVWVLAWDKPVLVLWYIQHLLCTHSAITPMCMGLCSVRKGGHSSSHEVKHVPVCEHQCCFPTSKLNRLLTHFFFLNIWFWLALAFSQAPCPLSPFIVQGHGCLLGLHVLHS